MVRSILPSAIWLNLLSISLMYFFSSCFVSWMDATNIPISDVFASRANSADKLPREISPICSFTFNTGLKTPFLTTIIQENCMIATTAIAINIVMRINSVFLTRASTSFLALSSNWLKNCSFKELICVIAVL